MSSEYTYAILFNSYDDLERKLVECFDRIRAKLPINFSELVAQEGNAIYTVRESFAGSFTAGTKSYQKEMDIRDFERRLIDYLERNKTREPNIGVDITMTHSMEDSGRSNGTFYGVKRKYELDGLFVTYELEDGVLRVRANFGYDDKASKSFKELAKLIDSEGRIITQEKPVIVSMLSIEDLPDSFLI